MRLSDWQGENYIQIRLYDKYLYLNAHHEFVKYHFGFEILNERTCRKFLQNETY